MQYKKVKIYIFGSGLSADPNVDYTSFADCFYSGFSNDRKRNLAKQADLKGLLS